MAYLLGKLAFLVLRPGNLLLLLGLAGIAGTAWRRRWGARAMATALLALALATLLPLGRWLTVPLEARFPAPAGYPDDIDGIVVLGGGVDGAVTKARGQPSFGETMERFASIPELARRYPAARILFTGGVGWDGLPDLVEADAIASFLARQGLLPDRVIMERHARSTRENALRALPLAEPAPGGRWLLVTSAMHMPRAIGAFRAAGWPEPLPWPVDFRTTGFFDLAGEPSLGRRVEELDLAAYEWLGLAYYRLLGYTGSIFPGPVRG